MQRTFNEILKPLPHQQFSIEVLAVRKVDNSGNLRALIDIQIGPFVFKGCRIIQQEGQKPWASLPQTQSKDGRWWPVVTCSDSELDRTIKDTAIRAFEEEKKN